MRDSFCEVKYCKTPARQRWFVVQVTTDQQRAPIPDELKARLAFNVAATSVQDPSPTT